MKEFNGTICFLTGAASGIGKAFAIALAKKGMNLFISDINIEGLEQVKNEVEKLGINVHSMKCDVSKFGEIEKAKNEFYSKFGELDLLINNAGIARSDYLDNIDLELWKNVIETNLWSVIYALKVFLPHMIERKVGHIVNMASGAGIFGSSEPLPYITSKFGVVGISEGLFSLLKPYGINVSVIVPAWVRTNIFENSLRNIDYNPKMLKDHGKEKLDEAFKAFGEQVMNAAMKADFAVRKYIRQIKKNQLYIFDADSTKEILALKGRDLMEYEKSIVEYQETQNQNSREHFLKYGIDLDDYY
jgi:short-subunit dehydrogenase